MKIIKYIMGAVVNAIPRQAYIKIKTNRVRIDYSCPLSGG